MAALDCVHAIEDYVGGKRLVVETMRLDPADSKDKNRSLKELG